MNQINTDTKSDFLWISLPDLAEDIVCSSFLNLLLFTHNCGGTEVVREKSMAK